VIKGDGTFFQVFKVHIKNIEPIESISRIGNFYQKSGGLNWDNMAFNKWKKEWGKQHN
jgi:hypothetical protein